MSTSQVLWLFALIFIPAGTVIGAAAYRKVWQVRALVRRGTLAHGLAIRLAATKLEGPGDGGTITFRSSGTTAYYPVIAWTTADGRAMETRTDIARSRDRTLTVGTRVEVRYDPAKPTRWTLPAESSLLWWLFVGIGALFVVIGSGFLVGALRTSGL
ncbi:DUF3592 domain-containing protein [Streptomyces sp. A0592]|uniref:DUF3592 domain-containing protein n=1 Tax=Streptomyces sp. A0592 TaxID=2563099 RepID=UPI00144690D8|nr:DUF3592 domain-containing protein [Streptomyces sp. A0592]